MSSYDGKRWGLFTRAGPVPLGDDLWSVSCPSVSFCALTDGNGSAVVWRGGAWGIPQRISSETNGPVPVSCPAAGFCVAVDVNGRAYEYANGTWTATTPYRALANFSYLSCPTTRFCAAVDEGGNVAVATA